MLKFGVTLFFLAFSAVAQGPAAPKVPHYTKFTISNEIFSFVDIQKLTHVKIVESKFDENYFKSYAIVEVSGEIEGNWMGSDSLSIRTSYDHKDSTKVYSLASQVAETDLVERPIGTATKAYAAISLTKTFAFRLKFTGGYETTKLEVKNRLIKSNRGKETTATSFTVIFDPENEKTPWKLESEDVTIPKGNVEE